MSGQALPKSRQQADLGGEGVEDRKRMTKVVKKVECGGMCLK